MEVKVLLSHGPFAFGCERVGDPPSADEHPPFFNIYISYLSLVLYVLLPLFYLRFSDVCLLERRAMLSLADGRCNSTYSSVDSAADLFLSAPFFLFRLLFLLYNTFWPPGLKEKEKTYIFQMDDERFIVQGERDSQQTGERQTGRKSAGCPRFLDKSAWRIWSLFLFLPFLFFLWVLDVHAQQKSEGLDV